MRCRRKQPEASSRSTWSFGTPSRYELAGRNAAPAAVEEALATRVLGISQISLLGIVDSQGMQRYRSRATGEPLADVSDRPYFTAQRDSKIDGAYINEPIVTRSERAPSLVMSRRLQRADGTFDGVVVANVTLQQIQQMYSSIDLGPDGALALITAEGRLVVRQPPLPDGGGVTDQRYPEIARLKGGQLVDRAVSPVDGRKKLISVVGVGNRPLLLVVLRDEDQALKPWYDELASASARAAIVILLALLAVAGLLRQLRRRELDEQALRQSEQRYEMALDAANEGHGEWDVQQGGVFASERWLGLHGILHKTVRTTEDVVRAVPLHPDDREAVTSALRDHLAGRTPDVEIEYRVRTGAANVATPADWRWIHARGRCTRDGDGKPLRLFCAATDVTARKEAEAERERLQGRLQQTQRLEALGTLAGGIAHDFNNVLGAILGFGEMARSQVDEASAARRSIDRVLQAASRARLLVRGILDFSRRGVGDHTAINVQVVVEEVIAMLAPTLMPEVSLKTDLRSGSAAVMGDATQLFQVVMNLCTNAVHAMGDTGALEVTSSRVQVEAARSLFQGDLRAGEYVCVEVADSGSGIPEHIKSRIFDPFFTTRRGQEGTGLGLSVVHGIVSDLGGAIDIVDRAGGGTRIAIWVPTCGDVARPLPTIEEDWPHGAGESVMVVDDEEALVALTEELLAGLSYEPIGYTTCEAALAALETHPERYDAIVSDVMLPGMNGVEFAERVRSIRPDLPILLVSGNVTEAIEARARAIDHVTILHKPVALRDLARQLAAVVASARAAP